jgi:hypothetical protein
MKARITFTTGILGTLPGDPEIAHEFVASKHPDGEAADEAAAHPGVDESLEKASTLFARNADGGPMLWDYQVKGFLKEACHAMIHMATMTKDELKKYRLTTYLYKRTIDQLIFVKPRQIPLELPAGGKLTFCERPLRGETMKGERVALVRSEMAPEQTQATIEIICLNKKLEQFLALWLTYGALLGIGQWRNSGMGRFDFDEIAE